MNSHINLKLSEEQVSFLEKIAIKNKLLKNKNEPSVSKALKFLLDNYIKNNNDLAMKKNKKLDNMERMLEQIHVMIPHILYHARYNSSYCHAALKQSKISEVSMLEFSGRVIKNVYQICGDFQSYNYQNLYLSSDNKNMKTIPIEEGENKWKLA